MPARFGVAVASIEQQGSATLCVLRAQNLLSGKLSKWSSVNECRLLRCRNICGLEADPTHRGHGRNDVNDPKRSLHASARCEGL